MPWWLLLLLLVSFGSPAHRFSVRISQLEPVQLLCSMPVGCHLQLCRGRCAPTKDWACKSRAKSCLWLKEGYPFGPNNIGFSQHYGLGNSPHGWTDSAKD